MLRVLLRLCLLCLLAAPVPAVTAQGAAAPPAVGQSPPEAATADEPAEDFVYVAPTRPDRIGRIMAPVMVNGRGPYAFIVDTGASRSAMAPRIAAKLGLTADPTQQLTLRGITGTEVVASILVDRLQAGDLRLERQRLPVVTPGVFADADGILGVEGFERMCLRADFANNHISITRNGCARVGDPWLKVPGALRPDRLLLVTARIRGVRIQTVIDTGAERTLGNLALLKALELERKAENPASETEVVGATSQTATGNLLRTPTIYLGEVGIGNVRVTFGDFEVFELWGLQSAPAMVLGMDVLGTVDALMIDYRRAEFRVLPNRLPGQIDLQRMRSPSRIR